MLIIDGNPVVDGWSSGRVVESFTTVSSHQTDNLAAVNRKHAYYQPKTHLFAMKISSISERKGTNGNFEHYVVIYE